MFPLARTLGPLLLGAWLFWTAAAASGVVISTGDGSGNTTAPADDPGFANVGLSSNSLTGVYMQDGWVLTAAHVGEPASFTFGGIVYPTVPGSRVRFLTEGVDADLAVVRVFPQPPLPAVVVATTAPVVDDVVIMIGNGRVRAASLTCWDGNFLEVSCGMGPPPIYTGFETLSNRVIRWGQNVVTVENGEVTIPGSGTSKAFATEFDEAGITDEAQVARGDSGGGAFLKRGSQWELVGILFAQITELNQPVDTAVFVNDSLMVDLAFYEPQIDAIVNPPLVIPLAPLAALIAGAASMAALVRRSLRRKRAV